MVKNHVLNCVLVIVGTVSASCGTGTTGYEADSPTPYSVYTTGVKEFSGVCYNQAKTALLAVSDLGKIYEINFDGTTRQELPYNGNNDFEAITVNHQTGEIYLADERVNKIYKMTSADATTLTEVATIKISGAIANKGLEGVSYGVDTLYITNQTSPAILIKYALKTGVEIRIPIHFATFLSDICYDGTDHSLWILDSKRKRVTHCSVDGEEIASQFVDMIKKPEALFVDRTDRKSTRLNSSHRSLSRMPSSA